MNQTNKQRDVPRCKETKNQRKNEDKKQNSLLHDINLTKRGMRSFKTGLNLLAKKVLQLKKH